MKERDAAEACLQGCCVKSQAYREKNTESGREVKPKTKVPHGGNPCGGNGVSHVLE